MKIIFLLILIIILFHKISIKFQLIYSKDNRYFNVYIYKIDITKLIRRSKKKQGEFQNIENLTLDFLILVKVFIEVLNKLKSLSKKPSLIIKNHVEIGLEDADINAIAFGIITNLIYYIYGIISLYVSLENKNTNVVPCYNDNLLKIDFEGILKIRIVQIIYISFLLITLGRKLNGTTSNRKFNEEYS